MCISETCDLITVYSMYPLSHTFSTIIFLQLRYRIRPIEEKREQDRVYSWCAIVPREKEYPQSHRVTSMILDNVHRAIVNKCPQYRRSRVKHCQILINKASAWTPFSGAILPTLRMMDFFFTTREMVIGSSVSVIRSVPF